MVYVRGENDERPAIVTICALKEVILSLRKRHSGHRQPKKTDCSVFISWQRTHISRLQPCRAPDKNITTRLDGVRKPRHEATDTINVPCNIFSARPEDAKRLDDFAHSRPAIWQVIEACRSTRAIIDPDPAWQSGTIAYLISVYILFVRRSRMSLQLEVVLRPQFGGTVRRRSSMRRMAKLANAANMTRYAAPRRETSDRPRIAVITVCLNDLQGLQATFRSLHLQSLSPDQWIVVDGMSNDGTPEWLSGINWQPLAWTSEPDGGIYEAMNKGLQWTEADYVLFLNSGDVLSSADVLEVVADALAASSDRPSLLYGDCLEVGGAGTRHLRQARPAYWVPLGMPTAHQAMYFRKDALDSGFDSRYRLSGDYAAVMKLYAAHRGKDFRHIPVVLCWFQLGGRSEQQRDRGLREDFAIRRQLLGMNAFLAHALTVLHHLHSLIKRHLPLLHRLARYG